MVNEDIIPTHFGCEDDRSSGRSPEIRLLEELRWRARDPQSRVSSMPKKGGPQSEPPDEDLPEEFFQGGRKFLLGHWTGPTYPLSHETDFPSCDMTQRDAP